MRNFFQRQGKFRPLSQGDERGEQVIPEDLWVKCPKCGDLIYSRELERNARVCPKCSHHFRLRARDRIAVHLDELGAAFDPDDEAGMTAMLDRRYEKFRTIGAWSEIG